jgi:hypothetical protein
MGAMMWFMGRGMMGGHKKDDTSETDVLADLRAEQSRLAAKIQALEPDEQSSRETVEPSSVA